jgi:polyisoprenoid-binding protein YceI
MSIFRKSIFSVVLIVFTLSSRTALSAPKEQLYQFAPNPKALEFLAIGRPAMLRIKGTGGPIEGLLKLQENKLSGELKIPTSSLETGISLRDSHLKETYLPVKDFPQAILILDPVIVGPDFSVAMNQSEAPFSGKLSLRGKEAAVSGTFKVASGKLEAKFNLKISDFGIPIPTYLGVTVADKVENTVTLNLERK